MNVQVFQQWEGAWVEHVNSTSQEWESIPQPSCWEATEPSNAPPCSEDGPPQLSCPLVL